MRITKRRWTVATRAACILWFTGAVAEPYPAFGQFGPIQVVDVETVQFHRNGLELAGTIFIPRSTDTSPGLVLVPAPRAKETAAYRRRVAEHFAGIGFTVLSYAPHRGRSISGDHPSAAVATALGAVVTVPGGGHWLTEGPRSAPFVPGALEAIEEWLRQVTNKR